MRVSSFQTQTGTCAQLPPADSQQIMLPNAVAIADSYFKFLQRASPSLPHFCLPQHSAGGEWSCVASLERGFLFSLKPQALFGKWLVCVCRTQWLCLHWIRCARVHPCMHIHSHMQALFSLEQKEECRAFVCRHTQYILILQSCCMVFNADHNTYLGWLASFVDSLIFLWVTVYFSLFPSSLSAFCGFLFPPILPVQSSQCLFPPLFIQSVSCAVSFLHVQGAGHTRGCQDTPWP